MAKNPRLKDVAQLAGVSIKTVSNVIRDYPHVKPETRRRVKEAIADLDYRPNAFGRTLATGHSGIIALAFSNVSLPYFAELARVFTSEAARRGYRLLLEQTEGTLEGERTVVEMSEAGLVDGMIFQPAEMTSLELSSHRSNLPMVLLGEGPVPLSMDRVMIDNVAAAEVVTNHLIAAGRRRIGFIGHELEGLSPASEQRIMGYQHALEMAGLPVETDLLIPTAQISAEDANLALQRRLAQGMQCDALVCREDLAAIGTLRALAERGISVPGDISVVGWDNIVMGASTYPSLTSVAANTAQMAASAMDMLEERIAGENGQGRHLLADFSLVVRESAP